MRVQVLGCSGGIGKGLRTTSILIDEDILIDCGTGVGDLTIEQMRALRHVFITHTHLDHIAALPLLIDTIYQELQEIPLTIHCQPGAFEILKQHIFNWDVWPDFCELPDKHNPAVTFAALNPGEICQLDGRNIEMIPVNHIVPCVGYRVESGDKTFAYSGDTTTNDALWEALNGYATLGALIVECAFNEAQYELSQLAKHYCPSLLVADLAKLKHRPRLYISHLMPAMEDSIMDELRLAAPDRDFHKLQSGDLIDL